MNLGAPRNLSNPFSTGGGGFQFESHIQAAFVVLMLAEGYLPCLPGKRIYEIKLQCKRNGYQTDDLVVLSKDIFSQQEHKLLAQVKHSVNVVASDTQFQKTITDAWRDFNNQSVFKKQTDVIALITGPLSKKDIDDTRFILEWARHCKDENEFKDRVLLPVFSSQEKQAKLEVFKDVVKVANGNNDVSEKNLFEFLQHFHILGYDLDIKAGVSLSLLHSLIGQYDIADPQSIWAQIIVEVQEANKNAASITKENLPDNITDVFQRKAVVSIPPSLSKPPLTSQSTPIASNNSITNTQIATIIGSWDENSEGDQAIIEGLLNEI